MGRRQQAGCGAGAASLLRGAPSSRDGASVCASPVMLIFGKAGAGGPSAAALLPPEWLCKLPRPGALRPEMLAEAPMIPTWQPGRSTAQSMWHERSPASFLGH